ncbi:MAG: hypothetical protein JO359_02525 [Candidatus Eremiobacteraeota bacterium]|nr:hypothetical protein [Candidatus Eremiobacteraeota bacterium]
MSQERKTVGSKRIALDGAEYKDVHFEGCELLVTGAGPTRLINCTFGENELGFDGAAARTIDTLTGMYASDLFKPFVEAVIDRIKGGLGDQKWQM